MQKPIRQLEEFTEAQNDHTEHHHTPIASPIPITKHWTRPPQASLKVNWDVALDIHNQVTGLGGILYEILKEKYMSLFALILPLF